MTITLRTILFYKVSVRRYFDRKKRPYFTEKLFLSSIFQYFLFVGDSYEGFGASGVRFRAANVGFGAAGVRFGGQCCK